MRDGLVEDGGLILYVSFLEDETQKETCSEDVLYPLNIWPKKLYEEGILVKEQKVTVSNCAGSPLLRHG